MSDLIRLTDIGFPGDEDCSAPIWTAIENAVEAQFKTRPFAQIKEVDHAHFVYVPSKERMERFEILAQHQRFKSEVALIAAPASNGNLGPVETDTLRFIRLAYPHLGVLVGGMGGGKSTTLKYLRKKYITDIKSIYCDLDADPAVALESPVWAARILSKYMAKGIADLISPSEEFTKVWTWGMSVDDGTPHHACAELSDAQTVLRRQFEEKWLEESAEAINVRKNCHRIICDDPQKYVTYLAFLIDYYLTVKCNGDRSQFLLVLDNIDPLPPKLQYELLRCASRVQESAQCKVLLALRPMTYTTNLQAGQRTVEIIEHLGPDALDLIESRIQNLVFKADLSHLRVRIQDEEGADVEIGENEIRYWIEQVLMSARHGRSGHAGEPTVKDFIEGVCNHSLRSALIVAPKLFTSSVIPLVLPKEHSSPRQDSQPRIRRHDLIRAVLIGRRACFRSSPSRVVDNIFDLGRDVTHQSLTCKLRLLKRLDYADNGILQIEQLREHLLIFDIPDSAILEGINSIIAQTKRLAWSDSVAHYNSFADAPTSKIKIAAAGRFYVRHAIKSLEYVQETHLDSPLPRGKAFSDYHNSKFTNRIGSLRLFLRHLHDVDMREVARALAMQRGPEYAMVYGNQLISSLIIKAVSRQVISIGKAMMGGKVGHSYHAELEEAIGPWYEIDNLVDYEDRDIVNKLASVRSDI